MLDTKFNPILNTLNLSGSFVDNSLSDSITSLKLLSIFSQVGVKRRAGVELPQLLFILLIYPLLACSSVNCFCSDYLQALYIGGKDVLYRFLTRQDIPWARINWLMQRNFYSKHKALIQSKLHAFVVDDTLKPRRGKKVEAAASHWDHNEGRAVKSHQVLTLGLAFCEGFISLASHICCGKKRRQERSEDFEDNRSEVARSYKDALEKTKNELLAMLLKKALRLGIRAPWLLGDAWFGTKGNIALALKNGMQAIFMMKRNTLKYRFQNKDYTAAELYMMIKRRMKPIAGGHYRGFLLEVELNLGTDKKPEWVAVNLFFSRAKHNQQKHGWVLVCCTDVSKTMEEILEIYALRWSIEVFFKEAKQHLGFLNNQSGNYVSAYASLHLAMLRYGLLQDGALREGIGLAEIRKRESKKLKLLSYMGLLWELFKVLIFGLLDTMEEKIGKGLLSDIKKMIGSEVENFLEQALQFDERSIKMLGKAEAKGF